MSPRSKKWPQFFGNVSIQTRMLLIVVPLIVVPMLVLAIVGFLAASGEAAKTSTRYLQQRENELRTIAENLPIRDYYFNQFYGITDEAEVYRRGLERSLKRFADRSNSIEPIYTHLMDGAAAPYADGLMLHRLRADAGYSGEVLLTAARENAPDYAVRCVLPDSSEAATSGDCQRDIKVGKDLSVLYRFSSRHLNDWDHIDAAIRTFVEARLATRSATSR